MRFASQQKVTGKSWMIVPAGSTVSFESPQAAATGLPSRKSATGWPCIHKSTKAIKSGQAVGVAKPSRKDDQSDVMPTSHGMRNSTQVPKSCKQPKHRGAASRKAVCGDTKPGRP
jgi:hypothetical protein